MGGMGEFSISARGVTCSERALESERVFGISPGAVAQRRTHRE